VRRKAKITTLTLISLLLSMEAWAGRLHPSVEQKLRMLATGEKLSVIVVMTEQAKLPEILAKNPNADRKGRGRAIVQNLQALAGRHQGPIWTFLAKFPSSRDMDRVVPLWIFNGFAVTATESLIRSLAALPEIQEVRLDKQIPLPAPSASGTGAQSLPNEWNIDLIRAPEVWAINPAYNGTGAVIGSFDTGVDLTHPDLNPRYRGNHHISWFDPFGEHSAPFDPHGHGTHTTGIAVGGSASGSNIGVAPGATWIAAKGWSDSGIALASTFHRIFEWFLAPGGNPDNAPDVVNSSWVFDEAGCQEEFVPDVLALRAAGIFPAFASGNDGPDAGSVRSPGAYSQSFTVGATDYFDEVAYFSSQGPSPCGGIVKPNISAPGDAILSAVPGGYEMLSGTSMATPHITGAVAVLRSINPAMTVEELEAALTAGARDLGDPGPDNASGAGRMDLFVSAQIALLGPGFPVVKVVAANDRAMEAGAVPGAFSISRTGNTDEDLVVKYTLSGTATAGNDYVLIPGSTTIPAGSASVTILVTPVDDPVVEPDETAILTILPDDAYIISGTNSATVTIVSDELVPDLIVSAFSAPATGGAGQSLTVTDTTTNQGQGTADPSVTKFYLSSSGTLDAAAVLIGARSVPALVSGASSSGSTAVTIPPGAPSGIRYILAKANADRTVMETSETNNTRARSILLGADLITSNLSAPTYAGAGESIAVSDTAKNQGGGTAEPSMTRFYLSSNGTLDASDLVIGSRDVPSLTQGATSTSSTTVMIPPGTAAGTWYILAKADATGAVAETSENNNTYARSIQIGADLVISSLLAPTYAGAGQSVTVSETTKNQGGGTADESVTRFYLSSNGSLDAADASIGSRSVPSLADGMTSSASTTVTMPPGITAGTWYIIAKADAAEAVPEISENNNTYARSIQIGADLVISSLSAPTYAGAGLSITVSETTRNQGGGTADATVTHFYVSADSTLDASDTLIGSRVVPSLAGGTTSSASTAVTLPQDMAVGTWYLIAKADGTGVVPETSENNNTSARSIRIGADLVISIMSAPTSAGAGQSITVSDTTKNQGGGTAGASATSFYLSSNGTLDASDGLIASRSVPELAAGAASSGSATMTIPPGTPAGTWYLIAKADAAGIVMETSENNNTYARSIQIGADLVISTMSAPSYAGAGQSIAVSDTTRNQGGGVADISATSIFLSNNGTLDAADLPLGSRTVPALAVGGTSSGSATVIIPPETTTGTWYIISKADANDAVAETSETNNTYARSIQIGADLVISSLSAPTYAGAGLTITVSETTRNQGGGTADATVTHFYVSTDGILDASDTLIGSRVVPSLAGGTTSSASTAVTLPQDMAVGTWYLIAKADGTGVVPETSENNNTSARSIQIGADLVISAMSSPTSAGAGQIITVSDTTRNQGGGAAGASATSFYLSSNGTLDASDVLIASRSVPELAAGAASSGSATMTIPPGTAAGTWYLIAKADAAGTVIETSENNNTYARSIQVSAAPNGQGSEVPATGVSQWPHTS
jgi:subtilase family serine protease